jgi:endonuclease YncB( thermonuclease family)
LKSTVAGGGLALLLGLSLAAPSTSAPATDAVLDRVVDGDTIVAVVGEDVERIRFLNVDTPEVGTCMADRATAFTEAALATGAPLKLKFDRELRDRYGRLLALVRPADGGWVSVGLAEAGLGFPMYVSPNRAYYPRVVAAAARAKKAKAGMFDPRRKCTPVARARRAQRMVERARSMPVRTSAQYNEANRVLNRAAAMLAGITAARYGVRSAYFRTYATQLKSPVRTKLRTVRALKKRQRQAAISAASQTSTGGGGSTSTGGSWWPPGVPHSYTGPRCYQPGGVIWYPC